MNPKQSSRKISFEVTVNAVSPALLEGLEVWLKLGLIDEATVKAISQRYLSCSLPETSSLSLSESSSETIPVTGLAREREIITSRRAINPVQAFLHQFISSFREELSLRWLLFLGLFLVIVSSGVLAATQWQKFSPVGQYSILWSYTLVFWVIGFWAKRQNNLQLTSQTLQAIALLLIPINFWAMDTFGLGQQSVGVGLIIVASLSLIGIYFYSDLTIYNLLGQGNYWGLNLLHWGWKGLLFPVSAIYGGTLLTAIHLTFFQHRFRSQQSNFSKILLIYGLFILLIRGIFFVHLSLASLGLAIGICGWLLRKQIQEATLLEKVLDSVGLILIILGWGVAVFNNATWQALGITGLGLHYFWDKLRQNWRLSELFALFIIGFQSLILIENIIPIETRENINKIWMQFSGTSEYSLSIYSLTWFPYILVWLGVTHWLNRHDKQRLAIFGEWLSLGLGICLTNFSLESNAVRSLNLLFSSIALIYLTSARPLRVKLIYFTHLISLLTLISLFNWRFSPLTFNQWGYFLILLTVGEWLNSLRYQSSATRTKKQWWYLSSWHFGFILAVSSFLIFLSSLSKYLATGVKEPGILAWLIIPSTLTVIAVLTRKKRRKQAALMSSYGFIIAQLLAIWQPGLRLISLGYSAVIVMVNSFSYKRLVVARLPIIFVFALGLFWIWEWLGESDFLNSLFLPQWVLFDGIYLILLWLLRSWFKTKNNKILSIYTVALDQVASVLCIFELSRLTIHVFLVILNDFDSSWQWIVTSSLITVGLIYRYWKEPQEITVLGLLLAIELTVIESIFVFNESKLLISVLNLCLAWGSFGLTNWLFTRFPNYSRLKSFRISPLLFAGMVIIWRLGEFTAYTGFLTFGVATLAIFVSNRFRQNIALIYLGFIGITLAFHEIIIYQLAKIPNFYLVNELILLCLLQVSLAFIYFLIVKLRRKRELETLRHISLNIIENIADLNWSFAIVLKILAMLNAVLTVPQAYPNPILFGLTLFVSLYAFFKAYRFATKNYWVYLGVIDIYLTVIFARWIWQVLVSLDPYFGLIATAIALIIYYLPWQQWGWELKPWRKITYSLPLVTAVLTASGISDFSLLSIAIFYSYLAFKQRTIRWSYLSIVMLNWLIFRFLERQNLTDILYYTSPVGLSILYLAQVDPKLQESSYRKIRHYLRILGSSIINVTALVFHQDLGIIPAVISLLTVLSGLGLKIRAFLFVGTITFVLTVFYQLVLLSFQYTLLKWIIGLVVGILLITIAANFERRREQMLNLLQNSLEQLSRWD